MDMFALRLTDTQNHSRRMLCLPLFWDRPTPIFIIGIKSAKSINLFISTEPLCSKKYPSKFLIKQTLLLYDHRRRALEEGGEGVDE